jgi:hypothetical protein
VWLHSSPNLRRSQHMLQHRDNNNYISNRSGGTSRWYKK